MTIMRRITGDTVRISDLATQADDGTTWIQDVEIDRCELTGPAVLLLAEMSSTSFEFNSMDPMMFWPLDDPGRGYLGAIGVRRARFTGCTFVDVGIAGPREVIDQFFA